MKWLLILILVSACTTSKKLEAPESAGESDAKQVSPYTLKPCYCMKIFLPVCGADGASYGNSCEAECHGNTNWTDGPCKSTSKKK